ncbi:hypothetical protein EV714DRAFT_222090 [Schizophyllum commune]
MIFSPRPPNPPGFVELSANAHHNAPSRPPFSFDPSAPSFQPSLKTLNALGGCRGRAVVPPAVARLESTIEQRHARRMDPYGVQVLRETVYKEDSADRVDYDNWPVYTPSPTTEIPCIEMTDAFEGSTDDWGGDPMDGVEDTTLVNEAGFTLSPTPAPIIKETPTPSLYSCSDLASQPSAASFRPISRHSSVRPRGKDQFSRGRCSICSKAGTHRFLGSCDSEYAPLHNKVEDENGRPVWVSKLEDRPDACYDFNEARPCPDDCPEGSHWCSLCARYTHGAQDCPLYFRHVGNGKFESNVRARCLGRYPRRRASKNVYQTSHNQYNVNNVNSHTATFGS